MLEQTGHDLEVRLPGDMQGIPPQPQAIPMRLEPAPPAWLAAHPPPPGMQLPAVDSLGQDDIGPGDVEIGRAHV